MRETRKQIDADGLNALQQTVRRGTKRAFRARRSRWTHRENPDSEPIATKSYDELKMPKKGLETLLGKTGLIILLSISSGIDHGYAIATAFSVAPGTVNRAITRLEDIEFLDTKLIIARNHHVRKICELTDIGRLIIGSVAKKAMDDDKHPIHEYFRIISEFKKSKEWEKICSASIRKVLDE